MTDTTARDWSDAEIAGLFRTCIRFGETPNEVIGRITGLEPAAIRDRVIAHHRAKNAGSR